MPIVLSAEFNPKLAFWAAVVPICAVTALDIGYVKPKRRRERAEKIQELRKVHADFIARQKKEAEEAIELLRESTGRKTKQEKDKDGLVIIEALYGNLNAGLVADVTIAVQALVNDSQLSMPGGHSKVKRKKRLITICLIRRKVAVRYADSKFTLVFLEPYFGLLRPMLGRKEAAEDKI